MSNIFNYVPNMKVKRSAYDLSYTKQGTFDMGQLIPIMCDEVVPGDVFKIGAEVVIRTQPLVAPAMVDCDVFLHYFFCPYRILWQNKNNKYGLNAWELFITGGVEGTRYNYESGKWEDMTDDIPSLPVQQGGTIAPKGSVGDYLGFPDVSVPNGSPSAPLAFPWYAYNMVYNECYRNENYQDPVSLNNNYVLNRNYGADYFTTALPWAQRGEAPRFPLSGSIDFSGILEESLLQIGYGRSVNGEYEFSRLSNDVYTDTSDDTIQMTPQNLVAPSITNL